MYPYGLKIEKVEEKKRFYKNKYFLATGLTFLYFYGIPFILAILMSLTELATG